ncbi:hypothetical protein QWY77_11015, partial [Thalassotalea ponticola]|uniref:hypothetical protein n=1 Tax=Thalassotalea ponticola TaxID=1523392 RepID=UPI0025B4F404
SVKLVIVSLRFLLNVFWSKLSTKLRETFLFVQSDTLQWDGMEFSPNKCFKCKCSYGAPVPRRLSLLAFFWVWATVPIHGPLFLYKGQPDHEVLIYMVSLFAVPLIYMGVVEYLYPNTKWDNKAVPKEKSRFWKLFGINFSAVVTLHIINLSVT